MKITLEYKKKIDIAILVIYPLFSVALSLFFKVSPAIATILFFGLPSFYLSLRTKKAIIRTLIFTSSISVFGIIVDHLAALDKSWHTITVFPFRIFGTVPLEDLIWVFFLIYYIVIFYEHFFDKGKHKLIAPHMKYFAYFIISVSVIFLLLLFSNSSLLKIPYFYLKGGLLVLLVPSVAFFVYFPKFISKFLKTAPYFLYVGLLNELTGLQLRHWSFPGENFIGWITILGYRFPYEELFFWLVIFSIAVLCFFEFFDDDKLKRD